MPKASKSTEPSSATFMDPTLMPWVLVSEVYWMSWKLLERRLYHLGVSASQARLLAVLYYSDAPVKPMAGGPVGAGLFDHEVEIPARCTGSTVAACDDGESAALGERRRLQTKSKAPEIGFGARLSRAPAPRAHGGQ